MNVDDLLFDLADVVCGHEHTKVFGTLTILLVDITQLSGLTKEEFMQTMELAWNSRTSELELEGHDIH